MWLALLLGAAAASEPRVRLQAGASPDRPEWTRGARADPTALVQLTFLLKQQNVHMLEKALEAVSDPFSARYGKHLSNAEVHAMVAPTPAALDAVRTYVRTAVGAEAAYATPNGDMLTVTVNVNMAERMLGCEYYEYTHATLPSAVLTPSYSLPSALAAHVVAVSPTVQPPTPLTPQPSSSADAPES